MYAELNRNVLRGRLNVVAGRSFVKMCLMNNTVLYRDTN